MSITSDVTLDYNAPLPCGLVFFPRIGTLAIPGAGGDDKLALIIKFCACMAIWSSHTLSACLCLLGTNILDQSDFFLPLHHVLIIIVYSIIVMPTQSYNVLFVVLVYRDGVNSFAIIALRWEKHILLFSAWTMNCK